MRLARHLGRGLGCGILLALDALFARLCVELDAAGALLSPGGAVPVEAFAAAAAFLLVRVALVAALAATAGLLAADLVGAILRRLLPDAGASRQGSR